MPKFVCNKFLIGQVVTAHIQLATVSDLYFLRRSGCCSHKGGGRVHLQLFKKYLRQSLFFICEIAPCGRGSISISQYFFGKY